MYLRKGEVIRTTKSMGGGGRGSAALTLSVYKLTSISSMATKLAELM